MPNRGQRNICGNRYRIFFFLTLNQRFVYTPFEIIQRSDPMTDFVVWPSLFRNSRMNKLISDTILWTSWVEKGGKGNIARSYKQRIFLFISKFSSLYSFPTFNSMTFTSRSKFTVNRCMKMFVPISPPSPFSTNSGVDFHHSEFHRRLLKYQWYYITLRDSQCIASRYPFSIVSRKLIRWKFTRSITLFERFRVFKIKIRIDLEKKKKKRKIESYRSVIVFYEHFYERSLTEMQATRRFDD